MYLYEVRLKNGRSHKRFVTFLDNATSLNAKAPDYGGISSVCLVAHSQNAETIHLLLARGMEEHDMDIVVKEITAKTLASNKSGHVIYSDLISNYFLPHNKFPNL